MAVKGGAVSSGKGTAEGKNATTVRAGVGGGRGRTPEAPRGTRVLCRAGRKAGRSGAGWHAGIYEEGVQRDDGGCPQFGAGAARCASAARNQGHKELTDLTLVAAALG